MTCARRLIAISSTLCLISVLNFIPYSIAQNNSDSPVTASTKQEDGVSTVEFDVLTGTVEVDLPDDMSETDTITGSVITEPKGETKEEIAKNEDTLTGYVVEIQKTQEVQEPEESKAPEEHLKPAPSKPKEVSKAHPIIKEPPPKICDEPPSVYTVPHKRNSCTFKVPTKCGSVKIVIKDHNGRSVATQNVRCNPKPPISPLKCSIPVSGTCGKSLCIPGPYDGRTSTCKVAVNNKSCAPVAISPRKYIASMPANSPGKCNIAVTNHGKVTQAIINLAPAKNVSPNHTNAARVPEQPAKRNSYYFRRSGPFIEDQPSLSPEHSMKVVQDPSQVTFIWTGPSVHDRDGQKSRGTFSCSAPPEIIRIGDKISFTGSVTGDRHYVPSASPASSSPWLKVVGPLITWGNSGSFVESGSVTYEVIDAKELYDDYYKQHPEMIGKHPPLSNDIEFSVLTGNPRGYGRSYLKWKYVIVNE